MRIARSSGLEDSGEENKILESGKWGYIELGYSEELISNSKVLKWHATLSQSFEASLWVTILSRMCLCP